MLIDVNFEDDTILDFNIRQKGENDIDQQDLITILDKVIEKLVQSESVDENNDETDDEADDEG